ncbi:hypothetical protein KUV57_13270 [Epibacterium sp. DP7N7-1]|nr:hypothetical protein [Epibacterium sp. DP7N7-1]
MKLVPGQNITLAGDEVVIEINARGHLLHAVALGPSGVAPRQDLVAFYGRQAFGGVRTRVKPDKKLSVEVQPAELPEGVEKVILCLSSWSGFVAAAAEDAITIRDTQGAYQADIPFTGHYERSLVLGEVYRRNGGFRFRVSMQGFMAGIPALNETYRLRLETTPPVRLEEPQVMEV